MWLKEHNYLYKDIILSEENLNAYPDSDAIPGIEHRVIDEKDIDVAKVLAEETAGIDDHPALQVLQSNNENEITVFLEKMGVSDPEQVKVQGRTFTADALRNIIQDPSDRPDLIIHRGLQPICEYNNPLLFPGMYPTLFPLGYGGFDDTNRPRKISFQLQANYFLDICDQSFWYHQSFIFVALNIIQRHTAQLHTSLTVANPKFEHIAHELATVSPHAIARVANLLEKEENISTLNDDDDKKVLTLLKEIKTIAAKIPGSEAIKLQNRNEIISYMGYFGLPLFFFTANPEPNHSPLFQVIYGDTSVNLDEHYPKIVSSTIRGLRIAQDPVAAADFFQICIDQMMEHLFGWDFKTRTSKKDGGILGHVEAFYGGVENTERGRLHAHFEIWMAGALNPADVHQRLKSEEGFDKHLFTYLENIIKHDLPETGVIIEDDYEPRICRPPKLCHIADDEGTKCLFNTEVEKCGEKMQRHHCHEVCHKYRTNSTTCRFEFPHDIVPYSYFDSDTNSIFLKCLDPMINYYNPYILIYCRHNHDLRCILSGKAAKAGMFYITDYITKMELRTYQLLSLLSRAVLRAKEVASSSTK